MSLKKEGVICLSGQDTIGFAYFPKQTVSAAVNIQYDGENVFIITVCDWTEYRINNRL